MAAAIVKGRNAISRCHFSFRGARISPLTEVFICTAGSRERVGCRGYKIDISIDWHLSYIYRKAGTKLARDLVLGKTLSEYSTELDFRGTGSPGWMRSC
jgi:hypothetical protein